MVKVLPGPEDIEMPETVAIGLGESYTFTPVPTRADGQTVSATFSYKSGNTNIATINANGTVTTKKTGGVYITVTADNGVKKVCTLWVVKAPTSVKLEPSEVRLSYDPETGEGETCQLTATLSDGSASKLTYYGYDTNVVEVSPEGLVTAKGTGKTTFAVWTYNGKGAACTVIVVPPPQSVTLSDHELVLLEGETAALSAELDNGVTTGLVYRSSAPEVAAVDGETGVIEALAAGETTVSVSTYNNKTDACQVRVLPGPQTLELSAASCALGVGETLDLEAVMAREDGADIETVLTWRSSAPAVAEVSAQGQIRAKAVGSATITVNTLNGLTAKCAVKVMNAPASVRISPTSVTLGYDEVLELGMTCQTSVTLPSGSASKLTYMTTNADVAVISDDGLITATGVGTATVGAWTFNGKPAACAVTVGPAPDALTLSAGELTLGVGMTFPLAPAIPEGTVSDFTLESSDEGVASISADGVITALAAGEATMTVSTFNGLTARCHVSVVPAPKIIRANYGSIVLGLGDRSAPLEITLDDGALTEGYSISISNARVATLDEDGAVVPVGKGTASLWVKAYNGVTLTIPVTVLDAPTAMSFMPSEITVGLGDVRSVAPVFPSGQGGSCELVSESPDIATVSASGVVTGIAVGTTRITATAYNGVSASCVVNVVAPAVTLVVDEVVNVMKTDYAPVLIVALDAEGEPFEGDIHVSVSPSNIAQYSEGIIKGLQPGTATLTVRASGLTRECIITVIPYRATHPMYSVAHRGGAGYWPENTLEAFANAPSTGAQYVELDVYTTTDGVQVIHHDTTFTGNDGKKYTVANCSLATLRRVKPGICTLEEALQVIEPTGLGLFLEFKNNADVVKCIDLVRKYDMEDRTGYMSFFTQKLRDAYAYDPSVSIGMAITSISADLVSQAKDLHLTILGVRYDLVTAQVSDLLHENGFKVCAWTVSDVNTIGRLYDMDVDYIMSDYPDRVVEVVNAKEGGN